MKKFITTFPFIHINTKNNNTLFYNTLSGNSIVFRKNEPISLLAKRLEENNFACTIEEDQISSLEQNNFFNLLLENNIGYSIDAEKLQSLPFTTQCIDFSDNQLEKNIKKHEYLLENIREITFYLNNFTTAKSHSKLHKAHHQFLFPVCEEQAEEIKITNIQSILKETENNSININIIGGNILESSNYQDIVSELNNCSHNVFYYFHYLDLINQEYKNLLSAISEKTTKVILVVFPFVRGKFMKWDEIIKRDGVKVEFVVENEEQITEAEQIISEFEIKDYLFRPYYNGINIDFFKENVFVNEVDILEVKESLFDLATKKISNPSFFGKLIINADGNIFTSFNFPSIGNINNLNLKNLIFNLLEDENSVWRVNKTVVEPCKNCIFNILCPPISNYELVLDQNNLCTVK